MKEINKGIIFITKDALCRDYLPTYGNKIWKTPNIDEIAKKGTVFNKHYTAAPSTVMSNMCMFTGKYPHESELSHYYLSNIHYSGESLWTKAEEKGYECHIMWDEAWDSVFKVKERYYCYGENTVIHNMNNFRQGVGAHYIHKEQLKNDDSKTSFVLRVVEDEIDAIIENASKPVFLWLHVPHVIYGRIGYGTDIDVFDQIVGIARRKFNDDNIIISSDHGNMNGVKGKIGYGHDVYEPAIRIPLITPRIDELVECNVLTSNIDISRLIFERKIVNRKYIYCDSTFYAQPNRKLAIVTEDFKYIYNKATHTEELYDLRTDLNENCNLISDTIFDIDRRVTTPLQELYFYPYWDELDLVRNNFRKIKDQIWKTGSFGEEFVPKLKYFLLTHGGHKFIQWKSKFGLKKK